MRVAFVTNDMPTATLKTLKLSTREQWRNWLAKHQDAASEVWLVFEKRHTHRPSIAYDDAVKEALCFGWIDSLIKRLDESTYARKFTPRKAGSKWSTANRQRYAELQAQGLLNTAGLKRAPSTRSGDKPPLSNEVPRYIEQALRANPPAWNYFEQLASSYRHRYVAWIDSAKQEETKKRRLLEAVRLLRTGQKLGLK
jgi:uncharacterized protein YdeI (YjbR/CyaY-like superfamily)